MKVRLAIALAASLAATATQAHALDKPNIDVECQANDADQIGKLYCSALRDAIAKSPRYTLGQPPTDGKKHFWTIRVSTIPVMTVQ
ncbi:hypothetical protein [Edaphobacter modestus]|uniref:Uncharacterized protein n=1 Tax=Edaphobacter modestus TaxID=388466 RepID=A0A4Q7XY66_9BACT|nr:hypothetical protein [Edaphobacter modestus]RZU29048.1 hypothetical protein BDD14_6642 [Edaphobacter modestus]